MAAHTADTHFRARIGQTIQDDNRYTILRKLGEGVTATTWLVRDSMARPDMYAAAKILTLEATQESGPVRELLFLREITKRAEQGEDEEGLDYLPALHDDFFIHIPAEDPARVQRHLCLVQTLYSTSVSALRRSAPTKSLPIYMVRNVIHMTLRALEVIHSLKIVHTDLKLDNILFSNALYSNDERLEQYLEDHPSEEEDAEPKPQPIPHEWTFETSAYQAERMTVALIDFGHAERAGEEPQAEGFSAPALRAPEIILSSGFGPGLDIWAVGCLTFELMVGRWLFLPEDGGDDWSFEDDHLAKMMELTGQTFSKSVLDRAKHRDKYFDASGNLRRIPELIPVSIETAMQNYNIAGLSEGDIRSGAEFIRECLNLDCEQRKSAAELVNHPFLKDAFKC